MDGQSIDRDPRTAEAMRQKEVFRNAMAELERKKRRAEGESLGIMALAYSFEPAARDEGLPAKAVHFSKLFLIAAAGILPNLLVITVLLS